MTIFCNFNDYEPWVFFMGVNTHYVMFKKLTVGINKNKERMVIFCACTDETI